MSAAEMANMTVSFEQILRDWLTEYKSLPKASLGDYASTIMDKQHVINAFHEALNADNYANVLELVQPVFHQLFEFFHSGDKSLRLFTICFFPCIVGTYLKVSNFLVDESNELASALGTFILSVYSLLCDAASIKNPSLFSENGIEIPNIVHSSLYHDASVYPFSERILSLPKSSSEVVCANLPTPVAYTAILPSNRSKILYSIMSYFLRHVSSVSSSSLSHLCSMCTYVACCGYPWHKIMLKKNKSKTNRRIVVESGLCIVILRSVYYALYNGRRVEAVKAVQAMQKRARYNINPQVLLVCNAIMNTINEEKLRVSSNSALGIATESSPMLSRTSAKLLKNAVTAKSIRHHIWSHVNEEVSGDFTESLKQDREASGKLEPIQSASNVNSEDSSKVEKVSLSPAKMLKAKIKKNVPFPSSSPGEKPRSLAIQNNEKKGKKAQSGTKTDDPIFEQRSRTPSGGQLVEFPIHKSKLSSTSVPSLKQLSIEDSSRRNVDRSNSLSKTDIEVLNSRVHEPLTGKLSDGSASNSSVGKKSKSEKKSKQNQKAAKDSETKELLKGFMNDKSKSTPPEGVPLLETSRKSIDEKRVSLTTTL